MSISRSTNTLEHLKECAAWWDEHKNDASDPRKMIQIQGIMIENLFDCLALTVRDYQELRGIPRDRRLIWMPGHTDAERRIQEPEHVDG